LRVRSALILGLFCFLSLTVVWPVFGQSSANQDYVSRHDPNRVKPSDREYKATEQAKRTTAILIVISLVNESKRYSDETLRVRTQARSADILWNVDEPFARSLFLQAWSAAEKIDEAAEEALAEAKKKAVSNRGGVTMVPLAPSLRSEILRFVARRDPKFGNTLVAKLDQRNDTAEEAKTSSSYSDPTDPKVALAKRLEVALQLLNSGDIKQAKAFAEPGLGFVTSPGIVFLCTLRHKDAEWADKQYAKLLGQAAGSPTAEALTVSLLSSYVLTPNYLVTATRRGRVANQFGDGPQTADVPAQLRARFFDVAAPILLRPVPPPDRDQTVGGRAGAYFTIARLLPSFETYAPSYVTPLNNQLQALSSDAPETFRSGQDPMLRAGFASQTQSSDELASTLDQLANAGSPSERDTLYVKAIRQGLSNGDSRIRQFAEKIENDSLREQARSFTDLAAVRMALSKNDAEAGLQLVRNNYLQSLHRVWAMTEVARLIRKSNSQVALDLLDNADTEAHKIDMGDPSRVYALACVGAAFLEVDRFRAWAISTDVVKAANSIPGFTGEDAKLSARLRSRNVIAMINADEPSFSISNFLTLLAGDDLQLALSTTNGLTGDSARALTSLALARAVLERSRAKQFPK
jgi:hypothetical protein